MIEQVLDANPEFQLRLAASLPRHCKAPSSKPIFWITGRSGSIWRVSFGAHVAVA
jgi:hypothetical protein